MQNIPALKEAAKNNDAMFGTLDTWLLYKLTGKIFMCVHFGYSRRILENLAFKFAVQECISLYSAMFVR